MIRNSSFYYYLEFCYFFTTCHAGTHPLLALISSNQSLDYNCGPTVRAKLSEHWAFYHKFKVCTFIKHAEIFYSDQARMVKAKILRTPKASWAKSEPRPPGPCAPLTNILVKALMHFFLKIEVKTCLCEQRIHTLLIFISTKERNSPFLPLQFHKKLKYSLPSKNHLILLLYLFFSKKPMCSAKNRIMRSMKN